MERVEQDLALVGENVTLDGEYAEKRRRAAEFPQPPPRPSITTIREQSPLKEAA